ncbi:MAG: sigma 54-interacting transcriptional regulator [bacterium]
MRCQPTYSESTSFTQLKNYMRRDNPIEINQQLSDLKMRLEKVNSLRSLYDYETLLKFCVDILPKIMRTERCTIFVVELGTDTIWSMFGTGLQEEQIKPPMDESIVGRAISTGECIIEHDMTKRHGYHTHADALTGFVTRSLLCVPIKSLTGYGVTAAIEMLNKQNGMEFTTKDRDLLTEIASLLATSIESIFLNQQILRIANGIEYEQEACKGINFQKTPLIAESQAMRNIVNKIHIISKIPVNIFIHGEHGTGKEVVARMIHACSGNDYQPFVAINCASIPEHLMESEFFGYEKGAFTGAISSHGGFFEQADGGILFLDEVADMPLPIQAKFLRVIQEGEGCRLGSKTLRHYTHRIISSTNKDLYQEIEAGHFREDFFYRLFSVQLYLPPLRERREDIIPLAQAFLEEVSQRFKKKVKGFSLDILHLLEAYNWPGNVRQLLKTIEHLVVFTPEGRRITMEECPPELLKFDSRAQHDDFPDDVSLAAQIKALEINCIRQALREAQGNKGRAAKLLGITRQGLHNKLNRYRLNYP